MALVTLGGPPLRFDLTWPLHASTAGADFHILHGKVWLLSDPALALHAEFAANVSLTIVEALPSLEPHDPEIVVITATHMTPTARSIQFKKSPNPIPCDPPTL